MFCGQLAVRWYALSPHGGGAGQRDDHPEHGSGRSRAPGGCLTTDDRAGLGAAAGPGLADVDRAADTHADTSARGDADHGRHRGGDQLRHLGDRAHPELHITAAHFRVAVREIWDRGDGIIAFADQGGAPRCVVGESFTQAATANPAYALPTVVHELWGHNEYGPYGQPGTEQGLEIMANTTWSLSWREASSNRLVLPTFREPSKASHSGAPARNFSTARRMRASCSSRRGTRHR